MTTGSHPTVRWLIRCLSVGSGNAYATVTKELNDLTEKVLEESERSVRKKEVFLLQRTFVTDRYCMFCSLKSH